MRSAFLAAALVLFSASVSGATTQVEPDTGWMKAGSPIYGLDVAADQFLMATPLKSPGAVAEERASEIAVAHERNNTEGVQRAERSLNKVSEVATKADQRGLEKAAAILETVRSQVPEEAQSGIATALQNLRVAQNRTVEKGLLPEMGSPDLPETGGNDSDPGSGRPQIDVPGR